MQELTSFISSLFKDRSARVIAFALVLSIYMIYKSGYSAGEFLYYITH